MAISIFSVSALRPYVLFAINRSAVRGAGSVAAVPASTRTRVTGPSPAKLVMQARSQC
jgi:hypothetical protein